MRIGLSGRLLAVALTLATAGCARSGHVGGGRAVGGAPQNPQRTIAPPILGGVPVPVGRGQGDTPNADLAASATAYLLQGRPADAVPLYERAAGQAEAGGDRAQLAVDLSSLALAYDMLGRSAEAERTYERALPMLEETLGPDDPEVARCLVNLSAIYWRRGAAAEARPLAERALSIAEAALGPDDPKTALARRNLALMTAGTAPEPRDAPARGGAVPETQPAGGRARRGQEATFVPASSALGATASAATAGSAPVPRPRDAGAATFALQLAAVPEPSGVAAEWRRLTERFPDLAGLEPREPRAVRLPGGRTFYRVAAGAFATRDQAQVACDRLRARGGACQVVAS